MNLITGFQGYDSVSFQSHYPSYSYLSPDKRLERLTSLLGFDFQGKNQLCAFLYYLFGKLYSLCD